MRIGMVCPYSFDVPGGVQSHVLQLAEVMRARGHEVSVLAPASPHVALPEYVVSAGRAVPIPYNGSVARLQFSPAVHRKVKKWLAEGDFDVLHLHEPNAPSLSMLALSIAEGPDRGDLSHLDHQIADAVGLSGPAAAHAGEDRRPDRGVRLGPALADGGAGIRRGGDSQRRRRRRRSPRRRCSTGIRGRARRCCSWAATTSPARAWPCCSTRCPAWSSAFRDCRC